MSFENGLALVDFGYACYAIPKFYGEEEKFNDWLSKVERVFACCDLNDQQKFKVVLSRMRGYVLHWWQSYMAQRKKYGKEKVRTWSKMKSELMSVFGSPSYEDTLLKKGSSDPTPTPTAPICFPSQKNQTPQKSQTLLPYPSGENKLEEKEEKEGEYVEEESEEEVPALVLNIQKHEGQEVNFDLPPKFDEYKSEKDDVLVMNRTWKALEAELVEFTFTISHPPRELAIFSSSFGGTIPPPSIPPPPQALNTNFCQVQTPKSHTQTSMGKNDQRVLKFKQGLFEWLILFQPELRATVKVIT